MRRLGRRGRWLAAAAAGLVVVLAIYFLLVEDTEVEPQIKFGMATSTIGEGGDAVGVDADGTILADGPAPVAVLPRLPIDTQPKDGVLRGPLLEQAKVLGAAPAPFRPCVEGSHYGETGVAVNLNSGIEVLFGDATRAADKWSASLALLADPEVTTLDYVNVQSPRRPSTGGSGHTLPPPGEGSGSVCAG